MYVGEVIGEPVRSQPAPPMMQSGRTRVTNVNVAPFRCVCRLVVRSYDKPGIAIGTGFLISPSHVLTCAHNIFPIQSPRTKSIEVFPAQDGAKIATRIMANGWAVSSNWQPQDCRTAGEDFGVIRLPQPIQQGYFGLGAFDPAGLTGRTVFSAGYPSSNNEPLATQMFSTSGAVTGAVAIDACGRDERGGETLTGRLLPAITNQTRLVAHDLDTSPSMSGSPLWFEDGGARVLFAIHVRSIDSGRRRAAVLLNDTARAMIAQWTQRTLPALAQSASPPAQIGDASSAEGCKGWMSDLQSFSKVVTDHYLRTEYPGFVGMAKSIWCSGDRKQCLVRYSEDMKVGVSFVALPDHVIARRFFHPTGPRCEYDFSCASNGTLSLQKRKCGPS